MSARSEGRVSTISMWSGGNYSEHTRGAKDVIDNSIDLALRALEKIDIEGGEGPFAIADFGAADGGTSIDLQREVIANVRQRAPQRPITITYTDLPRNDYSALFSLIHGRGQAVRSYLEDHDNIYVYASATSFFQRIFPPATIDFAFSATAMHWLSDMPCPISNHIHAVGAKGFELEALRQRALEDWETILINRAAELKPGGCFVTTNLAIDDQGRHMGNTGGINMFDTLNALWHAMVEEGLITQEEYLATNIPQFYKTLPEFCAAIDDPQSALHDAGLRLEHAQTRFVPCPYAQRFKADGDAQSFARAFVPTTRTWSETVFLNSLSTKRSAQERQCLVDKFFERYTQRVASSPHGHAMDYIHAYMVMRKAQ